MTEPTNAQLAVYVTDAAALLKRHGHDHAATHVQLAAQRLEDKISETEVKRAAKALWRRHYSIPWEKAPIADRDEYVADAAAVIAAARKGVGILLEVGEPTVITPFILPSGLSLVRRSQYDALLSFYSTWRAYEVVAAKGDSILLAVASLALAEKHRVLQAELRVAPFRVVDFDEEASGSLYRLSDGNDVH
jgi:hypothetical protein